jgi:hypothetical protein
LAVGLVWRFTEIGTPGAQLLVPIMFAVIEEKKENLTKDDIDFSSSLVLFHIETPIPSIAIETITPRFNNDPSSVTNHTKEIIELLKSPGDLIARVYAIAANLHRRAGYESNYWGIVVPIFAMQFLWIIFWMMNQINKR